MNSKARFISTYNSEEDFKKRILLINTFFNIYYDSSYSLLKEILDRELPNSIKFKNFDAEALIRFMIAFISFERGDTAIANTEFEKVLKMLPSVTDGEVRGQVYNFLAFHESHMGNYDKAFEYAYNCIKEGESSNNKSRHWGLYTLAVFYFDLKDYTNSEKFYTQALESFKSDNDLYGFARSETGLSSVYIQLGKYNEAKALLEKALEYYTANEITSAQSRSLNDLGLIYKKTGEYEKAIDFFLNALDIRKELHHLQGIATSLNEISETLITLKKYKEAINYLNEAKVVCEKINNRTKLYRTHLLFSQLYRNINEPWKALEHFDIYDQIKSDVLGEEANNKIKALQTKVAIEKSEKEAEIERLRNVELKTAYDLIEEKNKEILDSINYARQIQYTLLANDDFMSNNLKQHFVLFEPKDIVSGDFYWATQKGSKFYLAVCDSTGHGVPGAFMSLLNITFLNEAINEKNILYPNEVLSYVRKKLINSMAKEEQKDGMDGVLLCIDGNCITYAAAYNSPVLVRNNEAFDLEADKIPIGKSDHSTDFNLYTIELKNNDKLYLFTDGYADQFGGPKGKKFKHKQLLELLKNTSSQSFSDQKTILLETIENWAGNMEQVDDILIVGLSLS